MRWGFLPTVLLALLPFSAWAQEAPEPYPCFDVAVVARLVHQTPGPYPEDPEVIVMRWPWTLDFQTEQVFIGHETRARFRAMMPLHTYFRRDIDYFLLFLRRDPELGYRVVDWQIYVVLDRRGRFVMPFEAPVPAEDLRPASWIPANYEAYLRPIRYRSEDAWWLNEPEITVDLDNVPPGWYKRRGDQLVALRGLPLSDLTRMMANEPGAVCGD